MKRKPMLTGRSSFVWWLLPFVGLLVCFCAHIAAAGGVPPLPVAAGSDGYTYFPNGNVKPYTTSEPHPEDGRFLFLCGGTLAHNLAAASGSSVCIKLAAPAGATSLEVGIFDGDMDGMWDQGSGTSTWYRVYGDPNGDGSGSGGLIGSWNSTQMTDNAWYTLNVSGGSLIPTTDVNHVWTAQNSGGNYFFVLKISLDNSTYPVMNSFKVRARSPMSVAPTNFGIQVPFTNPNSNIALLQKETVYPNWPSISTTTYDGTWNFYLDVPTGTSTFGLWDGDMDYGDAAKVSEDTNDQDTLYFLQHTTNPAYQGAFDSFTGTQYVPAFAAGTPGIAAQGVAVGQATGVTGSPADDNSNGNLKRSPNVFLDVIDPNGNTYHNGNPSGNLEWERFTISSDPAATTATADYGPGFSCSSSFGNDGVAAHVTTGADGFNGISSGVALSGGIWEISIGGMDLGNANAFYPDYDTLGVDINGNPVSPLRQYVIGNTVWNDTNGNGSQDSGEAGIPGVLLDLYDSNSNLIQTATTDANGHYYFWVSGASYTVTVDPSNSNSGGPLNGLSATTGSSSLGVTVAGANSLAANFGYAAPGSIAGVIYTDLNQNSAYDSGFDTTLSGVTVTLSGAAGATTTSGANGSYLFSNLAAGSYQLTVSAVVNGEGLETTSPLSVTLSSGQSVTNQNFGYGLGSLAGRVFTDVDANSAYDAGTDSALSGVTVKLSGTDANGSTFSTTTTSGANGAYSFTGLIASDGNGYSLSVPSTASGEALETTSPLNVVLSGGQNATGADFDYVTGSISGIEYWDIDANYEYDADEDLALSGPRVTLHGTDVNGNPVSRTLNIGAGGTFSFTGLIASDSNGYSVSVPSTFSGFTLETESTFTVILSAGQNDAGEANFGYVNAPPGAISGTVWNDVNRDGIIAASGEPGIASATVQLYTTVFTGPLEGSLVASTTTDVNGNYRFGNLLDGSYFIVVTAPSGSVFDSVVSGAGVVNTTTNTGISNSPITVSAGNTTTNVDSGLAPPATGTIGDVVWLDTNLNGRLDPGEPGIPGVTVTLDGTSSATTTTDASGRYLFTGLANGTYTVTFTLPANYSFTTANVGSDPTLNSSADTMTGASGTITIGTGSVNFSNQVNCGLYPSFYSATAEIDGVVFSDANQDGIYENGIDTGIGEVTVQLFNSNNQHIATLLTSDEDEDNGVVGGAFAFTGLSAGTYTVKVVRSTASPDTLYETTPYQDSDPPVTNAAQDQMTITVEAGDVNVDAVFGYATAAYSNPGPQYITYTPGDWAGQGIPGQTLVNHFLTVYPTGQMFIGAATPDNTPGNYQAVFTSPAAIRFFLPQGGTPGPFDTLYVNPATTAAGSLAGQLLAAQLNVDFSAAGFLPNLVGGNSNPLGNLTYVNPTNGDDPFNGLTVATIVCEANDFLSGNSNAIPGASVSDLLNALTQINQNFANGATNNGYLN